MELMLEQDTLKQVLAGHRGHCDDYQRTSTFGFARQPFTWLSTERPETENQDLAAALREFKRDRADVRFEAWERDQQRWQLVLSGQVRVLYVEVDGRLSLVRALLQWAPTNETSQADASLSSQAV